VLACGVAAASTARQSGPRWSPVRCSRARRAVLYLRSRRLAPPRSRALFLPDGAPKISRHRRRLTGRALCSQPRAFRHPRGPGGSTVVRASAAAFHRLVPRPGAAALGAAVALPLAGGERGRFSGHRGRSPRSSSMATPRRSAARYT
jgi:hypothetical protein